MFHLRYYLFTAIVAITLVVVVLAAIGMLAYVVWYYVVAGWCARTGKSGHGFEKAPQCCARVRQRSCH